MALDVDIDNSLRHNASMTVPYVLSQHI